MIAGTGMNWVIVVLAVCALAACGKVGPPQPVGPPDKVIWPHAYPTPHLPPPPA
jgi:predicted small lipoprotein YifL